MTADLGRWVGKEQRQRDDLCVAPARGMAALLDRSPDGFDHGARLPAGWHWLYFQPAVRRSELAADGHVRRGDFLPPVSLPRRMWVGGRIEFHRELTLGDSVERRSTVISVDEKEGRSGRLVFVRVRHVVSKDGVTAIEEDQDLVYRDVAVPGGPRAGGEPPPPDCQWREAFQTDPVVLFRFSALTFNGHRIHYDHPYATEVEGYPGLVVHAPLTALLVLDAAIRHGPEAVPARFTYRAEGPIFCPEAITLAGRAETGALTELWAAAPDGRTAMKGTVEWAS